MVDQSPAASQGRTSDRAEDRSRREQQLKYLSQVASAKRGWVLLFLLAIVPFLFSSVWVIFHLAQTKHYYVVAIEILLASVFLGAGFFSFMFLYRGVFFQTPEQEADIIALRARLYFEGLGEE